MTWFNGKIKHFSLSAGFQKYCPVLEADDNLKSELKSVLGILGISFSQGTPLKMTVCSESYGYRVKSSGITDADFCFFAENMDSLIGVIFALTADDFSPLRANLINGPERISVRCVDVNKPVFDSRMHATFSFHLEQSELSAINSISDEIWEKLGRKAESFIDHFSPGWPSDDLMPVPGKNVSKADYNKKQEEFRARGILDEQIDAWCDAFFSPDNSEVKGYIAKLSDFLRNELFSLKLADVERVYECLYMIYVNHINSAGSFSNIKSIPKDKAISVLLDGLFYSNINPCKSELEKTWQAIVNYFYPDSIFVEPRFDLSWRELADAEKNLRERVVQSIWNPTRVIKYWEHTQNPVALIVSSRPLLGFAAALGDAVGGLSNELIIIYSGI